MLLAGAEAFESSLTVADGVHLTSAFDYAGHGNDEGRKIHNCTGLPAGVAASWKARLRATFV